MSDYKHGEMDITAQEKAFNDFIQKVTWGAVICIVVLILVALVNA